jgi:hypothetical protein
LANNLQADSTWFVSVSSRDFHLTAEHAVPAVVEVTDDIEGNVRTPTPSAGAFEFGAPAFRSLPASMAQTRHAAFVPAFDIYGKRVRIPGPGLCGRLVPPHAGMPDGLYLAAENGRWQWIVSVQ